MQQFDGTLVDFPPPLRHIIRQFAHSLHPFRLLNHRFERTTKVFKIQWQQNTACQRSDMASLCRLVKNKNPREYPHKYIFTVFNMNDSPALMSDAGLLRGCEILQHAKMCHLHLRGCNLTDITPLQCLPELQVLDLKGNRLTGVAGLEPLAQLTELNLHSNQLVDITSLCGLVRLRKLNVGNNNIADIASLEALVNLEDLHLGGNQVSTVTCLQGLVRLKELHLGGNQIKDITG